MEQQNEMDYVGEFYATMPITYLENTNGFGRSMAFRGPLFNYHNFNHSLVFIASQMQVMEEIDPMLPQWQVSARIIIEEHNVQTDILLEQKISKQHALAILDCAQEEQVRLKLYEAGMTEAEISNHDVCEEIGTYQEFENPFSIYDGALSADIFEGQKPFPFIMTTRQVLTNYDIYDYSDDDDDNDLDDDDLDNDDIPPEYISDYRPMEAVKIDLLCETINPDKAKTLESKLEKLNQPYLFVAKFQAEKEPILKGSEDYKLKPTWKIFSVEGKWLTEVMQTKSLAETIWVMDNLEQSILESKINADELHKVVKDNYRYHFSHWRTNAEEIDLKHANSGFEYK